MHDKLIHIAHATEKLSTVLRLRYGKVQVLPVVKSHGVEIKTSVWIEYGWHRLDDVYLVAWDEIGQGNIDAITDRIADRQAAVELAEHEHNVGAEKWKRAVACSPDATAWLEGN